MAISWKPPRLAGILLLTSLLMMNTPDAFAQVPSGASAAAAAGSGNTDKTPQAAPNVDFPAMNAPGCSYTHSCNPPPSIALPHDASGKAYSNGAVSTQSSPPEVQTAPAVNSPGCAYTHSCNPDSVTASPALNGGVPQYGAAATSMYPDLAPSSDGNPSR